MSKPSHPLVPLFALTLLWGCQTPNVCTNALCNPPVPSTLATPTIPTVDSSSEPVSETRPNLKDLLTQPQEQATTQWHLRNPIVSSDGLWALGYQQYRDQVTFTDTPAYYAAHTRVAGFGLFNLTTQTFTPLYASDSEVSVLQSLWLSADRYLTVVRPGGGQPAEIRLYQVVGSDDFERLAQAETDGILQVWHSHPWLIYQQGERLTRLNLDTRAQSDYGPIPHAIEKLLTTPGHSQAYVLTQSIAAPETFRIQLSPPLPKRLYALDFATGTLTVVDPPGELSYHGVSLSLSPAQTRLLVATSMTAYGPSMTSFVTDTRQALYAADVNPLQLLRQQATENASSVSNLWFDQAFWPNEDAFYSYRKESLLQLVNANAAAMTAQTLSTHATALGLNAAGQMAWLDRSEPGTLRLQVRDGQYTRTLQTWTNSQVLAYSTDVGSPQAWFEISDAEGQIRSYVFTLANLELRALPLRNVQPLDDVNLNLTDWYVSQ